MVVFSAGRHGKGEAGPWEFWTVVSDKGTATGRCRPHSDPGQRFRDMEGRKGYEKAWSIARAAKEIRPATAEEVIGWLIDKSEDAPFAQSVQIAGKTMSVVKTPDGFMLEENDSGA